MCRFRYARQKEFSVKHRLTCSSWMNDTFNISKQERLQLLCLIAQAGAERDFDRQGNLVMLSPISAIAGIRKMNRMMGDNASQQIVEAVPEPETRSEEGIRENIKRLNHECEELTSVNLL